MKFLTFYLGVAAVALLIFWASAGLPTANFCHREMVVDSQGFTDVKLTCIPYVKEEN